MTSTVSLCVQQLETQGWAVVEAVLSPKMIALLTRGSGGFPEFRIIRQVFEGLPMRIMETIAGRMVLSMARYGVSQEWHRGRDDIVASGAPADFISGFDVGLRLDSEPCILEVISGSARLGPRDVIPLQLQRTVEVAVHAVVILDSRTVRRWSAQLASRIFWFSVVRPWIMPLMNFFDKLPKDTPPRALQFAGMPPAKDVGEWLFRAHPKRSE